ncbi:thermonuclease family protein [Rubidibacter lacunae]|uniref:thermonuclease family protein n=1 Tax=Rubidibacter lacunae TaxID=582514 RepID=UPI00041C0881|nr:thermonuclease family protein [Rubidibacter lacunae]
MWRTYLRSLFLDGTEAAMAQIEQARYERTVSEVFLGNESIDDEIVRVGMAWHYQELFGKLPQPS